MNNLAMNRFVEKDSPLFERIINEKKGMLLRNREHIKEIYCIGTTGFLRFIEREGKKILQQEYIFRIYFTHAVSYGSYDGHTTDQLTLWEDVPFVQ